MASRIGGPEAIHIEGLRELRLAFKVAGNAMDKDLDAALKSAAEPVRQTAETLALTGITRIGIPWSRMRVGITAHTVYVAPAQRGQKAGQKKRKNIASKLRDEAMEPALTANLARVRQEVVDAVHDMGRAWGRV